MINGFLVGIDYTNSKCDNQKYCICLKSKKQKCADVMDTCYYPVKLNPLCIKPHPRTCVHRWSFYELDDRKYVLYRCPENCPALVKDKQSLVNLMKQSDNKRIFFGKDLAKLITTLEEKYDSGSNSNPDKTINLFNKYFDKLGDVA